MFLAEIYLSKANPFEMNSFILYIKSFSFSREYSQKRKENKYMSEKLNNLKTELIIEKQLKDMPNIIKNKEQKDTIKLKIKVSTKLSIK